jgi:hypothetical protein
MEAAQDITASMAALTATPLFPAGLDAMPPEGPRRMTEVGSHIGSHEKPADPSRSTRHPQNLLSKEPYVLVQEAAPPRNAHVVRLDRDARSHARASHAVTVAQIHAKVLSRNCGSFSEKN